MRTYFLVFLKTMAVKKKCIEVTKAAVAKKKALPAPPGKQVRPEEEAEATSEESENSSDSTSLRLQPDRSLLLKKSLTQPASRTRRR